MGARWEIAVADLAGNELGELTGAKGRELSLANNGGSVFSCTVPLTSDAAELISTGDRRIKAYRTPWDVEEGEATGPSVLRFHGAIWAPEKSGSASALRIVASDPFVMLEKRITQAVATGDQGALIKALIDAANALGETGIRALAENVIASVTRSVDWSGTRKALAEVVAEFAGYFDGCDVELRPLDNVPGKAVDLIVWGARRGADRPGAAFEYGTGTGTNCNDASQVEDMSNLANYITAYGDGGISVVVYDTDSIARYGRYEAELSFTDVTLADALTALAIEELNNRKTPKSTITVNPSANAPAIFDEWDIGDTVYADLRKGALQYTGAARAKAATVSINDNGGERVSSITLDQEGDLDAAA